jgi:hypothetical protein
MPNDTINRLLTHLRLVVGGTLSPPAGRSPARCRNNRPAEQADGEDHRRRLCGIRRISPAAFLITNGPGQLAPQALRLAFQRVLFAATLAAFAHQFCLEGGDSGTGLIALGSDPKHPACELSKVPKCSPKFWRELQITDQIFDRDAQRLSDPRDLLQAWRAVIVDEAVELGAVYSRPGRKSGLAHPARLEQGADASAQRARMASFRHRASGHA